MNKTLVGKRITLIICIVMGVMSCATSIFGILILTTISNPQLGLANIVVGAFWLGIAGMGIFVVTNKKVSKWFF